MTTEHISHGQAIVWQENSGGVPEPAIYVRRYDDVLQLLQEDRTIHLSPESLEPFIKAMRRVNVETPKATGK